MLLKQKGPISHSGTPEKPFIIIANEGQQLKRMHAESNPFTTMAWIIFGVKFAFRKKLKSQPLNDQHLAGADPAQLLMAIQVRIGKLASAPQLWFC